MKKQNELVLLSEHTDQANASIENWKTKAAEASAIIQVFNDISLLNPITTQEQCLKFLEDPGVYFDESLQRDLEFSCKAQPIPKAIAGLFGIEYDAIKNKIAVCKLRDLLYMVWDEETQVISFDEKCTQKIMKCFFEYSLNANESDEIVKLRAICKPLNELAERFNLQGYDFNTACNGLKFLKAELKEGGQGYELTPNILYLRDKLQYEAGMEGVAEKLAEEEKKAKKLREAYQKG